MGTFEKASYFTLACNFLLSFPHKQFSSLTAGTSTQDRRRGWLRANRGGVHGKRDEVVH